MSEDPRPWDVCEIAYRAAHDLQAPLLRIGSFAELLSEDGSDVLDERALKYLDIVSRSAGEASALVDRLLALTLAVHRPLREGVVDVRASAEAALEGLAEDIARTGATIELGEPGVVDADPELLTALLAELLGNAVRFREPGRAPRIELRMDYTDGGDAARLRLADDGPGVPEGRRGAVLEPFEGGPDADGISGPGLGLALCRVICERHGWTLELHGVDAGTEVRILLSRRGGDDAAANGATRRGKRIA